MTDTAQHHHLHSTLDATPNTRTQQSQPPPHPGRFSTRSRHQPSCASRTACVRPATAWSAGSPPTPTDPLRIRRTLTAQARSHPSPYRAGTSTATRQPPSATCGTTASGSNSRTGTAPRSHRQPGGHSPVGLPPPRSARARHDRPAHGTPIAHHHPMTVLVDLANQPRHIGRDHRSLQRRRQHPAGTLGHDLVQQDPSVITPGLISHYSQHRRSFLTGVGTPALVICRSDPRHDPLHRHRRLDAHRCGVRRSPLAGPSRSARRDRAERRDTVRRKDHQVHRRRGSRHFHGSGAGDRGREVD